MSRMILPVDRCVRKLLSWSGAKPARTAMTIRTSKTAVSTVGFRQSHLPSDRRSLFPPIPVTEFGQNFSRIEMMAGPITTTNKAGKTQNTMGTSILTGAFCARS